jgi:Ca-activated chloride channel homolog
MPKLVVAAVIGLSTILLAPAQQGRGEEPLTISVSVDAVVLNVTVTDRKGRHVSGLAAGDFRIYEDNRPQTITLFAAEDGSASIGLVIDRSGSMLDKRADVVAAALAFVGASNPDDEMFVVTFNEHVSLGLPPSIPFTSEIAEMRGALLRTLPTGLTALYDAVTVGLEHVNGGTRDRKALVVLSDGGDNASAAGLDEVLESAARSNATIYTVGMYDETDRDRNPRALRRIAEASGGRAYFPQSLSNLQPVWRAIASAIRSQYTIGYVSTSPAHDGRFRHIRVTARPADGGNLRVTTRHGYRAAGPEPVAK